LPDISTLIEDIYSLFGSDKIEVDKRYLDKFSSELTELVNFRLSEERKSGGLRLSSIGKPDRQQWFDVNWKGETEELTPPNLIKFMYGDILEHLLLLFARQAGHTVEFEQVEVEIDGVPGHPDAVIDGVVVDVKSANSWQFDKFEAGDIEAFSKDVFLGGYLYQLAAYVEAINPEADGAFLAVDKTLGKLCLFVIPNDVLKQYKIRDRVEHVKKVVQSEEIPPRCYEPKPEGKSGNFVLATGCSYCKHKFHCWSDANDGQGLRRFIYSSGPKYFTHVEKEPRVMEGGEF
jgi:hypothetical protein